MIETSFLRRAVLPVTLMSCLVGSSVRGVEESVYVRDVRFGLEQIGAKCAGVIEKKKIDWEGISKEFLAEAGGVQDDQEHLLILNRLLARLQDGHAEVRVLEKGRGVASPKEIFGAKRGPGMFLCRVGKRIYVKSSWNAARGAGIEPGMEVVRVDGMPAGKWLAERVAQRRKYRSYSTEQQAFYDACHKGLVDEPDRQMKLELRDLKGKRKKKTVPFGQAKQVQWGPAFFPKDSKGHGDLSFGRTKRGWGYLHVRRCKGDLPEQVDYALEQLGKMPGLILDFRGNTGGGFDHRALMGRFVPEGETLSFVREYESAGPRPFGGNVVVIVDAGVASAGETGSGIFKEHGRAYMIGESATAGMSSQKTKIDLPSGLFSLYVSIGSNMASFNEGRGIEGIGVLPHEIVEYDPRHLAEGQDTLILRAEKLLKRFPSKSVPYRPKK